MKDMSGTQWTASWNPAMSALIGRQDEIHTPDGFGPTPSADEAVTEMEAPDEGSVAAG